MTLSAIVHDPGMSDTNIQRAFYNYSLDSHGLSAKIKNVFLPFETKVILLKWLERRLNAF